MSAQIPVNFRDCRNCTYYIRFKQYCRKLSKKISDNFAPYCSVFSTDKNVKVIGSLCSVPEGHKITKKKHTYNDDKDIEKTVYYEDSLELFTITYSYNDDKNIEWEVRTEKKDSELDK